MGYFYNVPTISKPRVTALYGDKGGPGRSYKNLQKPYKQKGPTCWYYAAKMILEFHEMYSRDPHDKLYQQFKVVHELRKAITEVGSRQNGESKSDYVERIRRQLSHARMTVGDLKELAADLDFSALGDLSSVSPLDSGSFVEKGSLEDRLDRLLSKLDDLEEERLNRLEIFTSLIANTFIRIETNPLSSNVKLEEALARWGPFYAGGALSVQEKGAVDDSYSRKIVKVEALKEESAHAVVVAGVQGQTVYFIDPNHSNELRTIQITALAARAKRFIGVLCRSFSVSSCRHCVQKRTVLPGPQPPPRESIFSPY